MQYLSQVVALYTTGSNTPDALHASRSSVQWPHIPYGIGVKPYKTESEPVTPHVPAPPPPRQLVLRTQDSGKMAQLSTFTRTATAPAAIPRVNLRPARVPSTSSQILLPTDGRALPHRVTVSSAPAARPLMTERGLIRSQSSTPVPTTMPWTAPGFVATSVNLCKVIPHAPESVSCPGSGPIQSTQHLPLKDASEQHGSLTTSKYILYHVFFFFFGSYVFGGIFIVTMRVCFHPMFVVALQVPSK